VSADAHEDGCHCFECHFARRIAMWKLWCELLTELNKEILHRHWRATDFELVAVAAPKSIWYSIELFRPHRPDPPLYKVIAYWPNENRIHVHVPGTLEPIDFPVRIEKGTARLDGKNSDEFVSSLLAPFR
jgi:hypothetical protein